MRKKPDERPEHRFEVAEDGTILAEHGSPMNVPDDHPWIQQPLAEAVFSPGDGRASTTKKATYEELESAARLVVELYAAGYDYSKLGGHMQSGHCCVCDEGCDTAPVPMHEDGCPLVHLAEVLGMKK